MMRPASASDIPAVVSMVISAWGTGDYSDRSTALYSAYVEGILASSSFSYVHCDGGQVLGAVFCRMEEDNAYRMPSPGISAAMLRLMMSGSADRVRSDLRRMIDVADMLLDGTDRQFDGEMMLIVVSPHVRGRGIGTALFRKAVEGFSRRGASEFYIMSDDRCDNGFLVSRGAERSSVASPDTSPDGIRPMAYAYRIRRAEDDGALDTDGDSTRS